MNQDPGKTRNVRVSFDGRCKGVRVRTQVELGAWWAEVKRLCVILYMKKRVAEIIYLFRNLFELRKTRNEIIWFGGYVPGSTSVSR